MLIAQSVISQPESIQNNYPQKIIYKGDTVVIITIQQVKKLNKTYLERDKYKTLTDSLNKQSDDYELVIIKDKELIDNLKEQLILKDNITIENNAIITDLNDKNKKLSKKVKVNSFFNKGLIVITIILGILLVI